jgi:hypothetical protein
MSDHEQFADERERDADRLEDEAKALEARIDETKATLERAENDPFIATPAGDEPDQSGPEADYPTKR